MHAARAAPRAADAHAALLVTTCVHLALLVATGAVAIVLLQHQNSYGTLTVGIDDSRRAAVSVAGPVAPGLR